jgi:sulfur carrier protein
MNEIFTIVLNGTSEKIAVGITVFDLLLAKMLDPARVVVEVNKNIIKRDRFGEYIFQDGDIVEVLRFVGGG